MLKRIFFIIAIGVFGIWVSFRNNNDLAFLKLSQEKTTEQNVVKTKVKLISDVPQTTKSTINHAQKAVFVKANDSLQLKIPLKKIEEDISQENYLLMMIEQMTDVNMSWERYRSELYAQIDIDPSQLTELSEARVKFQNDFIEILDTMQNAPAESTDKSIEQIKSVNAAFDQTVEAVLGVEQFNFVRRKRDMFNVLLSNQNSPSQIGSLW